MRAAAGSRGAGGRAVSALDGVILGQLVLLAAVLLFGVLRYPLLITDDEYVHLDYVAKIAQEGRLPVLGKDLNEPEVLALLQRTYPGPPAVPAEQAGLSGQSYEAFQPPAYYALVAPLFHLSQDWRIKIRVLRAASALIILVGVSLLWRLCHEVVPRHARLAFAFCQTAVLLPVNLLTLVGVTNAALESTLAVALALLAWRSWHQEGWRSFAAVTVILGALLLTKLTAAPFALVVLALLVRKLSASPSTGERVRLLAVAALPVLMLAPWVAFNLVQYGSSTANALQTQLVLPTVNPQGVDLSIAGSLRELPTFTLRYILPQALGAEYSSAALAGVAPVVGVLLWVLPAALLLVQPRRYPLPVLLFFALPTAAVVAALVWGSAASEIPLMIPRYSLAALPLWTLTAFLGYFQAGPGPRLPTLLLVVLLLVLLTTYLLLLPAL